MASLQSMKQILKLSTFWANISIFWHFLRCFDSSYAPIENVFFTCNMIQLSWHHRNQIQVYIMQQRLVLATFWAGVPDCPGRYDHNALYKWQFHCIWISWQLAHSCKKPNIDLVFKINTVVEFCGGIQL